MWGETSQTVETEFFPLRNPWTTSNKWPTHFWSRINRCLATEGIFWSKICGYVMVTVARPLLDNYVVNQKQRQLMNCSRLCALLLIVLIIASKLFRKKKYICHRRLWWDTSPHVLYTVYEMEWNTLLFFPSWFHKASEKLDYTASDHLFLTTQCSECFLQCQRSC